MVNRHFLGEEKITEVCLSLKKKKHRTYLNEKFPFETYAAEIIAALRFGRCANSAGREEKEKHKQTSGFFLVCFSFFFFLCVFPCVFLKPIKFCSCPGRLSSHKGLVDLLTCAALLLNWCLWLMLFRKNKNKNSTC